MEPNRLLNMRSGVLHRYPAFESCNVDAIPLTKRLLIVWREGEPRVDAPRGFRRSCKRCFKAA